MDSFLEWFISVVITVNVISIWFMCKVIGRHERKLQQLDKLIQDGFEAQAQTRGQLDNYRHFNDKILEHYDSRLKRLEGDVKILNSKNI